MLGKNKNPAFELLHLFVCSLCCAMCNVQLCRSMKACLNLQRGSQHPKLSDILCEKPQNRLCKNCSPDSVITIQ